MERYANKFMERYVNKFMERYTTNRTEYINTHYQNRRPLSLIFLIIA